MRTDMKVEKNVATATGSSNRYRRGGVELTKSRPKFEGETVELDRVCFDCSNGNNTNNYSQGMIKVAEYFGRTATYGTYIQSTIMKESPKVTARPAKVNIGNVEIVKMLIGKQLSEWVSWTSKLSANMGQAYNVILGQSTTFTRSKLESLKGWEAMSESSDLISLVKGIDENYPFSVTTASGVFTITPFWG